MKKILRKAVSLVCAAGLLLSDLGSLSLAAPAPKTRELVASERDSYRVTVTYSVNEAMPDGLRLSVSEVEKPEEEPQEEPVEEIPEESSEVSGEETPEETSAESAETSQEESQGESASEAPAETPAKAPLKAAAKAAQEEKEDNSPYGQYVKRSLELLKKEKKDLRFARVFNIALVDPATGATVQPDKKVKVSIQLEDAPSTHVTKVIHFGEKPEVVECTAKGESVEFTAAGFSVYVVARLGNYEYRIEDDSERTMTLGALLEKLNVTEFEVQDVISLTSSSEAITVGSDWTITFPDLGLHGDPDPNVQKGRERAGSGDHRGQQPGGGDRPSADRRLPGGRRPGERRRRQADYLYSYLEACGRNGPEDGGNHGGDHPEL